MEGKQEHVFFPQPYINLPQTKMWKIISYRNTFPKLDQLKCGRDLKYPTGVEELFFGRKTGAHNYCTIVQKFSTI